MSDNEERTEELVSELSPVTGFFEDERMTRTSSITRTYSLGDYKNIKFTDTIRDIPEKLALDKNAMNKLRSLQLFQIERSFLNYLVLKEKTRNLDYEEAITYINNLEEKVSTRFIEMFENVSLDNGEEEETDGNA